MLAKFIHKESPRKDKHFIKRLIEEALQKQGTLQRVARYFTVNPSTITRKMQRHGIRKRDKLQ
jgi:DNA-binding NtrC family response regulator